jgi:hypothetical protein
MDMKYCTIVFFFLHCVSRTLNLRFSLMKHWTVTQGPSVFLSIITRRPLAIFKFVARHRHFRLAGNFLAVNTHKPATNPADLLLLLAKMWEPRRLQTWNKFQWHRPFCSLVKLRHADGEQGHKRGYFSATRRTSICEWYRDVARNT